MTGFSCMGAIEMPLAILARFRGYWCTVICMLLDANWIHAYRNHYGYMEREPYTMKWTWPALTVLKGKEELCTQKNPRPEVVPEFLICLKWGFQHKMGFSTWMSRNHIYQWITQDFKGQEGNVELKQSSHWVARVLQNVAFPKWKLLRPETLSGWLVYLCKVPAVGERFKKLRVRSFKINDWIRIGLD